MASFRKYQNIQLFLNLKFDAGISVVCVLISCKSPKYDFKDIPQRCATLKKYYNLVL